MRCAVVGAGAWGTALADLLARNGHEVRIWAFESDVTESINRLGENTRFLRGHRLSDRIHAFDEIGDATQQAELITFATPSQVLRDIARRAHTFVAAGTPVVVASKGIERTTLSLMTAVAEEELHGSSVVALSGPSFAAEVVEQQPTAVVVASRNDRSAQLAQRVFSSAQFRAYTHSDVTGVELGGALKNVMAVATGIAEGLGLGFNARAALITRGLAEMTRLGARLGARAATLAGLAGLGDLVLTCTGSLSRNRAVGLEVGRGRALEDVLGGQQTVAEGVVTARSAFALAQREGIEMPIVNAVHQVLFGGQPARDAISALMNRELRSEGE